MAERLLLVGLLAALGGCASSTQDRVKQFHDDGVTMYNRGDYRAARESFELALTLTPEDANLLYNLGQCNDRLGDVRKAETFYQECLRLRPEHVDARYAYGMVLFRTGRQEQAKAWIDDWLVKEPKVADAYALDAWRLRQEKAIPQAQGRLQQALAIDPQNARALIELGLVYESLDMPQRARVLYERVLARNPKNAEVAQRLEELKERRVGRPLPEQ